MQNIKLTLSYDGTRYQGWQRPGKRDTSTTISGKLTETLSRMTGEEITLFAGVKTEPNVHAEAQIVNFKTKSVMTADEIRQYSNHYLPQDISVLDVQKVEERFHATLNAQSQTYVYRVDRSPVENVFTRKYRYHLAEPLDLSAMQEAANVFIGRHDFQNFSSGKSKKSTEKELFSIQIIELPIDNELQIILHGNDFLHQMPRYIVGTLLELGLGKRDVQSIDRIFLDKEKAGLSCPAHGLCLKEVTYPSI